MACRHGKSLIVAQFIYDPMYSMTSDFQRIDRGLGIFKKIDSSSFIYIFIDFECNQVLYKISALKRSTANMNDLYYSRCRQQAHGDQDKYAIPPVNKLC